VFPYFKPHNLVGLDINAEEIRLLQLRSVHSGFIVESFAISPIPPRAVQEGKILDLAAVIQVLKRLVEKTTTTGQVAAMALPVSRVISKRIKLAADLAPTEYEAMITTNFPQYFPGFQEELCFDYVTTNDSTKTDVLLVAARVEQLHHYTQVAEQAGLRIKIVDVDTYALARAASAFSPQTDCIAWLDITPEVAQLIILQEQKIIFSQYWHTAGKSTILAAEINRAIQSYAALQPAMLIKNCMVSGMVDKMPEIFSVSSAIPFIKANPLSALTVNASVNARELQQVSTKLMICCGLAMRRVPTW
jgi:type IV pilus assembly protein PilM